MKLIIQIPAFNEQATIAQTLRDLPKKIEGVSSIETLIVDDGSTDKTVEAARQAGVHHVVQLKNHRGLSAAFVAGIDACLHLGADIIVNTDADNQYAGADVAKLIAPIIRGTAEVVIGDRDVATSPHMSPLKRFLQRLGSWTVGRASGVRIGDATSGFRAFTRDAAMQINVFNPFTYTLETIIQAGNRNLGIQSVTIRTNAPTRPSRLYRGLLTYVRKTIATTIRVYAVYRPLKTFFFIGSLLLLAGTILGLRFVIDFIQGDRGGHVQSLILAAVFLITGFHTLLIALLADLVAVNRRLSEEVLIRLRKLEAPRQAPSRATADRHRRERPPRRERQPVVAAPAENPPAKQQTQWVWLLNDEDAPAEPPRVPEAEPVEPRTERPRTDASRRRRRRRGGGMRQHTELPGNRGKHLGGNEPGPSEDES
ncbi:MAG TPA: glycosyltransferase family 2 protein [Thermoanaerobaculia bacterium]|nr:glycosyltransferase family 2 protein [Thermoanaerobaculia bacterium]